MNNIRKLLNITLKVIMSYGLTYAIWCIDGELAEMYNSNVMFTRNTQAFVFVAIHASIIWGPLKRKIRVL